MLELERAGEKGIFLTFYVLNQLFSTEKFCAYHQAFVFVHIYNLFCESVFPALLK